MQEYSAGTDAIVVINGLIDEMKRHLCFQTEGSFSACSNMRNSCCKPGLREAIAKAEMWLEGNTSSQHGQSCAECEPVDEGTALYCVRCIDRIQAAPGGGEHP